MRALIHARPEAKEVSWSEAILTLVRIEPVRELVSVLIKKGTVNRAWPDAIGVPENGGGQFRKALFSDDEHSAD